MMIINLIRGLLAKIHRFSIGMVPRYLSIGLGPPWLKTSSIESIIRIAVRKVLRKVVRKVQIGIVRILSKTQLLLQHMMRILSSPCRLGAARVLIIFLVHIISKRKAAPGNFDLDCPHWNLMH